MKKGFFKGVKAEFAKILWPKKSDVAKETVAVISVSAIIGVIIFLADFVYKFCLSLIS